MKSNIFKVNDIRGIYPSEINKEIAYKAGQGFVAYLNKKRPIIVVGRDLRKSSNPLSEAFINGAMDLGARIISIGVVVTPALYFAVSHLKADASAMITASHNPIKYNGIKFTSKNAKPISGKELEHAISEKKKRDFVAGGTYQEVDIMDDYLDLITKDFKIRRKIKIAFDDNKSVASLFTKDLASKLGIKESKNPDFYVSFDYDGDRLVILNKNRKMISGDSIGAIIGESVINKKEGFVYVENCARSIPKYFRDRGVVTIPSKVGHFNLKKMMRLKKATYGMEFSGHYYFKELNYVESPFFALRKILEQLDKNPDKTILNLVKPFEREFHSGILNIKTNKKKSFEQIIEELKEQYKNGAKSSGDGLKIVFSNWWFNVRPSNTEPLVRLVVEANKPGLMEEKKKEILALIK